MKKLVLGLVFLTPLLVLLVLLLFGDNQYDIPVYYSSGVDTTFVTCESEKAQHKVPLVDAQWLNNGMETNMLANAVKVLYITNSPENIQFQNVVDQLTRVKGTLADWDNLYPLIITSEAPGDEIVANNLVIFGTMDPEKLNSYLNCGLILNYDVTSQKGNKTLVLIDNDNLIRGYYDASELDEIDRLMVELRILKSNADG